MTLDRHFCLVTPYNQQNREVHAQRNPEKNPDGETETKICYLKMLRSCCLLAPSKTVGISSNFQDIFYKSVQRIKMATFNHAQQQCAFSHRDTAVQKYRSAEFVWIICADISFPAKYQADVFDMAASWNTAKDLVENALKLKDFACDYWGRSVPVG